VAASPKSNNPKYDPNTYSIARGDHININGTWIAVGNYEVTYVNDGVPLTVHYQAREIMRIRDSGSPTSSQLQFCSFFYEWNSPLTIPNDAPFFSIPAYRFTVQSMTQMQVVVQPTDADFKVKGEMVARKISSNPDKPLGSIIISANTIDANEDRPETMTAMQPVTLFANQKFPISCFSELESHDRMPSFFNIFRAILPSLPVAMISSSHSLQVAFDNHYMKINSETLIGADAPEGHIVELYKGTNPWSDDDIPSRSKFFTMGGPPQNFIKNLYDQTPQLNSAFHFETINIPHVESTSAEGIIMLDTR